MNKDEMHGAHGTYGSMKKCMQGVWWGNLKEGDHLQKPRHEDTGWEGVDWMTSNGISLFAAIPRKTVMHSNGSLKYFSR